MKYILMTMYLLMVIILYIKFPELEIKQCLFPLLSVILILGGEIFFENIKKYYISLGALVFSFLSIFLIIHFVDIMIPFSGKDYLVYTSFTIAISQIILLFCSKYLSGGVKYNFCLLD